MSFSRATLGWWWLRLCLVHLLLGPLEPISITTLMIMLPVMIKQVQTGQFPSKLPPLPHKSKALASAIIFNNEIYHLVLQWFSNFFWCLKTKVPLAFLTLPPPLVPDTQFCWLGIWPSALLKLNEGSEVLLPRQLLQIFVRIFMLWGEPAKLPNPTGRTAAAGSFRVT